MRRDILRVLSLPHEADTRRLLARLELPDGPTGCWIWTGATQTRGYGSIARGDGSGETELVHRFAWELWIGPLGDLTVDHRCQVRLCFNPAHLVAVPREINCARGAGLSPLYCVRGHPIFGTLGSWTWHNEKRRCYLCQSLIAKATGPRVRRLSRPFLIERHRELAKKAVLGQASADEVALLQRVREELDRRDADPVSAG